MHGGYANPNPWRDPRTFKPTRKERSNHNFSDWVVNVVDLLIMSVVNYFKLRIGLIQVT